MEGNNRLTVKKKKKSVAGPRFQLQDLASDDHRLAVIKLFTVNPLNMKCIKNNPIIVIIQINSDKCDRLYHGPQITILLKGNTDHKEIQDFHPLESPITNNIDVGFVLRSRQSISSVYYYLI